MVSDFKTVLLQLESSLPDCLNTMSPVVRLQHMLDKMLHAEFHLRNTEFPHEYAFFVSDLIWPTFYRQNRATKQILFSLCVLYGVVTTKLAIYLAHKCQPIRLAQCAERAAKNDNL